jgi:hypothetical protein
MLISLLVWQLDLLPKKDPRKKTRIPTTAVQGEEKHHAEAAEEHSAAKPQPNFRGVGAPWV